MRTSAIDPMSFYTVGGQERKFLLTTGSLRRLRKGIKQHGEEFDDLDSFLFTLYHARYPYNPADKETFDAFCETLPASLEELREFIMALQTLCGINPTGAGGPAAEPATTMESNPGPSGQLSFVDQEMSTTT